MPSQTCPINLNLPCLKWQVLEATALLHLLSLLIWYSPCQAKPAHLIWTCPPLTTANGNNSRTGGCSVRYSGCVSFWKWIVQSNNVAVILQLWIECTKFYFLCLGHLLTFKCPSAWNILWTQLPSLSGIALTIDAECLAYETQQQFHHQDCPLWNISNSWTEN